MPHRRRRNSESARSITSLAGCRSSGGGARFHATASPIKPSSSSFSCLPGWGFENRTSFLESIHTSSAFSFISQIVESRRKKTRIVIFLPQSVVGAPLFWSHLIGRGSLDCPAQAKRRDSHFSLTKWPFQGCPPRRAKRTGRRARATAAG